MVLCSIGNPGIMNGSSIERPANISAYLPAPFHMLNPEFSYSFIRAGKREPVICIGMTEASTIEINFYSNFFCPINPTLEMYRLDLVSVNLLSAKVAITGMHVKPVFTGQKR